MARERMECEVRRAVADDAVQQCWRVSPGPDFVLVVAVRDMPAYQALAQRLPRSPAGGAEPDPVKVPTQ